MTLWTVALQAPLSMGILQARILEWVATPPPGWVFLSVSDSKESPCNAGQVGKIPEEVNGNPLQYSYLENSMDRGAWQATVCGVEKSRT